MNFLKKTLALSLILFFALQLVAQQVPTNRNEHYFDINKNMDIFNSVMRELDLFYVDSIKVNSMMQNTIVNMLTRLDPYTEYYSEENMNELRFLTTGEYAGIGAIISYNNGKVIINQPYRGLPADKAGLKAGDIFIEIDGEDVSKANVKEVSDKLKGTPGTTLQLTIERPGEKKHRKLSIVREKIEIPPIAYSTVMDKDIGYLHFGGFTEKSADQMKETLNELKNSGAKSFIIDLRGNGGGILEEAVKIVNFFVPKGKEIVSTKGKVKKWDRVYRTQNQPLDELSPIVVLVDTGSASASEIVAGALQDMDRAVIVGNRSFGKGLVQMTRQLPYGGSIKLTTAKYYIPSGRCIQALDYSHRNPDGSVARVPDSLTQVFYTHNGREVRDGGGITPDITIEHQRPANIVFYLAAENIIFDFVTEWVQKHPKIAPPETFSLSDVDYNEFKAFVKAKNFTYDRMSARTLQTLQNIMEFEGYKKAAEEEFKALEEKLRPNPERDLELFREDIKSFIESEIIQRYYYKEGVLIYELRNDKALQKAKELIKNPALYQQTLQPSEKKAPKTVVDNKT